MADQLLQFGDAGPAVGSGFQGGADLLGGGQAAVADRGGDAVEADIEAGADGAAFVRGVGGRSPAQQAGA